MAEALLDGKKCVAATLRRLRPAMALVALVATPVLAFGIGHCGRYVVLKHSYPNGRVAFTRYAQLGRIAGSDGRPITVGATIRKKDRTGELGPTKTLHFELRPVAPATTQTDAAWQARYGNDPTMDWSRYDPVDPQKFDADVFGGRRREP